MTYQPKIPDSLYIKWKTEEMLEKELNIKFIGDIASGIFGEVVVLEMPSGERKAGKIVKTEMRDFKVWPYLDHKNLVQLERNIFMPDLKASIFVMPLQYRTLESIINTGWFQEDDDKIFEMKRWLLDTLSGVEYLHSNNICHLNIDPTNILVSYDSKAKLSSFGLLCFSTQPVVWSGPEFPYYPPELCYSRGENVLVDPIGVDLWSIGMTTLRLFTKTIIREILGNTCKLWSKDIYKTIFRVIKYLDGYIPVAYPDMNLSPLDVKRLKNFISMFLSLEPERRPSAETAKKHRFLSSGLVMPKRDAIWKKKASSIVIEMIVEKHNTNEIVKKRCEERKRTCTKFNLKPHDKYQFIKLSVSSKGEKNLSNYAEKNSARINKMEGTSEKCNSAVVQDLSPMHNEKVKQDTPLRNKTVRFVQSEEFAGSHSPEKCESMNRLSLAVHSDENVPSAWDRFRMETPAEELKLKRPNSDKESTTGLKDTASQKNPDVLNRETPDVGEKHNKSGWLSRTKSWIVRKFHSFGKS